LKEMIQKKKRHATPVLRAPGTKVTKVVNTGFEIGRGGKKLKTRPLERKNATF